MVYVPHTFIKSFGGAFLIYPKTKPFGNNRNVNNDFGTHPILFYCVVFIIITIS